MKIVRFDGSGFYDAIDWVDKPTTRYFYDGQMCFEDEYTEIVEEETVVTVGKYGLGARGIDWMSKKVGAGTEGIAFPIYDGHGNMVLNIARTGTSSSSPSYSLSNRRNYDVWGSGRTSAGTTSPTNKQRYCANLGHVEDDASGLQYMRARFYEPWTGRFVSEDPAGDGMNWYVYCSNEPISKSDPTGKFGVSDGLAVAAFLWFVYKFVDNGEWTLDAAGRHLLVGAAAAVLGKTAENTAKWLGEFAVKAAKFLNNVGVDKPYKKGMKGWINPRAAQIDFWVGYGLFLMWTADYLEAWAAGEAD